MTNPHELTAANPLAGLAAVDEETTSRLHERLVRDAEQAGVLDVAYRTIETPVGDLLLAATEKGLVRVAYAREGHDRVLEQLSRAVSPRVLRAPARLDDAAHELDEYFGRKRSAFDLPLDLRLAAGFRRSVLACLPSIPFGETASYASVAAAAGSPRAARAVGTACRMNPLPLLIPCHRVVRGDGSVGEYIGGADAKRALLALEAAP
jgi:methylated-DNA-[protein]-cysteine S-methyltransferase